MFGLRDNRPVDGAQLARIVAFSRAGEGDIVACVGPGGHALATAFAQKGRCTGAYFERTGPSGPRRIADLVVVAAPTSGDAVGTLLCANMHLLKPAGRLVLRLEALDDDCIVQSCLSALGYRIASTVFELSQDVLVAHSLAGEEAGDAVGRPRSAKPALSFGQLYHSSAVVGSTPTPGPFLQSAWS